MRFWAVQILRYPIDQCLQKQKMTVIAACGRMRILRRSRGEIGMLSASNAMRTLRWVLFLMFLAATWFHLGLRQHRGTRLESATGHYYVTSGREPRREESASEFQELITLKQLSWTLFWGNPGFSL